MNLDVTDTVSENLTSNGVIVGEEKSDKQNDAVNKSNYLCIAGADDSEATDLIDTSSEYAHWLRVVLLRTLVNTKALNALKNGSEFTITRVCGFLGLQNFEEYSKDKTISELRASLVWLLNYWEQEFGGKCVFPERLSENLEKIKATVQLSAVETNILGLIILLNTECILSDSSELIGTSISSFAVPKIIASMLAIKLGQAEEAFDDQSNLVQSGLISLDHADEGSLRFRVDLITRSFAKRAIIPQKDASDLVKAYAKPASLGTLSSENFHHVSERLSTVKTYLKKAVELEQKGVNILIYGMPGTGKTEFAKLVCQEIGLQLIEVTSTNLSGNPVTPMRRIRSYGLAQKLYTKGQSIILFDECEEILCGPGFEYSESNPTSAQKSWINHTLENNKLPTIWIANSIQDFDHAYIRRFDLCFEMPLPNELQRRKMLADLCGKEIDQNLIIEMARNKHTSPALVAKTAKVAKTLNQADDVKLDSITLMLVNDKLRAQGSSEIKVSAKANAGLSFNLEMINSSINLETMVAGLKDNKEARICIYGPPGTGKTAFGKWLSESLAVQHLVYKASDLLGSHVGETERNIADAFYHAARQKALLQFDEVDTFLLSRTQAKQSWEISMVNEMLTQMETYDGIFIASTNLFENLDEASLRRFDISVKFDFMHSDKAWKMFLETCLQLNIDPDFKNAKHRLGQIKNLTPGDFAQVIRQSRFYKPESAEDLIKSLNKAADNKKSGTSKNIGFLQAA